MSKYQSDKTNVNILSQMLHFIWIEIDRSIDASFSSSAVAETFQVPSYQHPPKPVLDVLYYISGWLLSSMLKSDSKSPNPLFLMFYVHNRCTPQEAEKRGLPTYLVKIRDRGSLINSGKPFLKLICLIDHAFSNILTLT